MSLGLDAAFARASEGAAGEAKRPVVAHVLRAYLNPTETFIYKQIASARRYRPITVAHHYRPNRDLPVIDGTSAAELMSPPWPRLSRLAYRASRTALPQACRAMAERIEQEQSSVLHFHYLVDARFLRGVKRRLNLPAVVSGYGYDVSLFPRQMWGLGRRYLEPIFSEFDLFLAMSEDMRTDMIGLGCPEERIRVHFYGVDSERFQAPDRRYDDEGTLTVLCCGTLQTKKAQHLVLEALARVEDRGVRDFRVVLVGDGPMRAELEAWVRRQRWEDRVLFAGHVPHASDELVEHYRRADVFALPSVTVHGDKEGIPTVLVEAMAAGLPVVSSYHAGIPAAIESGVDGLLVPEYDVEALADAFERVLDDAALRRRLGEAAAATARTKLDLEAGTRELENIYDELLEHAAPAPARPRRRDGVR